MWWSWVPGCAVWTWSSWPSPLRDAASPRDVGLVLLALSRRVAVTAQAACSCQVGGKKFKTHKNFHYKWRKSNVFLKATTNHQVLIDNLAIKCWNQKHSTYTWTMLKFNPKAGNFRITLPIIRVGGDSLLLRFFFWSGFFSERFCHHPSNQLACSCVLRECEAGSGIPWGWRRESCPKGSFLTAGKRLLNSGK